MSDKHRCASLVDELQYLLHQLQPESIHLLQMYEYDLAIQFLELVELGARHLRILTLRKATYLVQQCPLI